MIRLRTLGTIGLTTGAGEELSAVLRQPKRFALLAYLALARPRGFQRRDALLALFWPELDDDHARAALRQSLYTLRRELPPDTILSRGDAEVGLQPGVFWCDVHEMEDAAGAGRARDALSLYRGELLAGFHVPEASQDLDYWLAAERERLRQVALGAASEATRSLESEGEPEAAVWYATRAVEISPLDEDAVRRQMRLLHRVGDRSGALLSYEQWARRLREELELEPSPRTAELADQIRRSPPEPVGARAPKRLRLPQGDGDDAAARPADPSPSSPPAVAAHAAHDSAAGSAAEPAGGTVAVLAPRPRHVADPHVAPDSPAGSDPPREAGVRRWPGPRSMLAPLAGTALLVLAVLGMVRAWSPFEVGWSDGTASPSGQRLIVLPFSYSGGAESSYLTEGLVHLFSVAMDGDEFRTVDPHTLVRRAGELGGERGIEPVDGLELAERLEADFFLLGTAVETEGRLQLTAALYDGRAGRPLARSAATGTTADVLDLVDRLAADLLTMRAGPSGSRVTRLAAVTTPSLTALKSYLAGERLLREGRFAGAIEAFEDAVLADTLFALAQYRMSLAASWAFRGELATRAAERAARNADRLPEHERRLLAAHEAYRRGEASRALQMLRELSAMYPEDPEVWYRLGEVILHFGPLHGWSIQDAREPFRRAAELAPLFTEASYHLAQIDAAADEPIAALGHVRRALADAPDGSRTPQLRTIESVLTDARPWSARLSALRAADDFAVISTTYNLAVYLGRPDHARSVARLLTEPRRPPGTRAFGRMLLADLEAALGRWTAVRQQLEALAELDPVAAGQHRAFLATAPAAGLEEERLRELAAGLASPAPAARPGAVDWGAPPPLRALERPYLRGLLAARLRDRAALDPVLAELGIAAADTTDAALAAAAAELATDLKFAFAAETGLTGGFPLQPPTAAATAEASIVSPVFSRPSRRYLQGRWLERQGQLREALGWYESLMVYSVHDLPWGVPALLDRARIHEALGEPDDAAHLYRRLVALTRDADDPLLRRTAQARLARLETGPTRRP